MIEKTKNTKLKPIRFDDTRHAVEKRLADNVVSAKALLCGDYQEHGRSYYSVQAILMLLNGRYEVVENGARTVKQ